MAQTHLIEYFRRLRTERGIIQSHLARKLGITRSQFTQKVLGINGAKFSPQQIQIIEGETGEMFPEAIAIEVQA